MPTIGGSILPNAGFEESPPNSDKLASWSAGSFVADRSEAHSGTASLRLRDATNSQWIPSTTQTLRLKKGVYRIGGWMKTNALGSRNGGGVRLCLFAPPSWPPTLGSGCTSVMKGTADWTYQQRTEIVIAEDTQALFSVQAYGKPDGTAWFDDLELRQERQPLEVFMQYPNYRGLLFDDQSQLARFQVTLDPADGVMAGWQVAGSVALESTGQIAISKSLTTEASQPATFDFTSLTAGAPYLVQFTMSKDGAVATYPAYRVIRVAGAVRRSMNIGVDDNNRFLLRGKPAFLLGVYDSGLGYSSSETGFSDSLESSRRLFELPLDLYLNYWYGAAPNGAILPLMDLLHRHHILNLTNANCFGESAVDPGDSWFLQSSEKDIQERTSHAGFGGFYAADECEPKLAADVFRQYQRMARLNPGGVVFGVLLPGNDESFWRDNLDVMATDPYPLYGAEPAGGYPLNKVADAVRRMREAVQSARPFMAVIQYFKFTAKGRWPTEQELRQMSYGAIVEGANGLWYWSLGQLDGVCPGWCEERTEYFERLKRVTWEIRRLDPVLTIADAPELLASAGNPAIRTRVKSDGRIAYVIAFNNSRLPQSAAFEWSRPPRSVSVYQTSRSVTLTGGKFNDSFEPFGTVIYRIELNGSESTEAARD